MSQLYTVDTTSQHSADVVSRGLFSPSCLFSSFAARLCLPFNINSVAASRTLRFPATRRADLLALSLALAQSVSCWVASILPVRHVAGICSSRIAYDDGKYRTGTLKRGADNTARAWHRDHISSLAHERNTRNGNSLFL